jgi:Protein of unknown function (DUF4019)
MREIRRRVLLAVVACGLVAIGPGSALAQDPRGSAAQAQALAWLALSDRDDAAASWRATGKQFQGSVTIEQWGDALHKLRPPLGAVLDRTLMSTQFTKSFPGAVEGEYALLVFRSRFAEKSESRETVTLQREADGAWRVIGYVIS